MRSDNHGSLSTAGEQIPAVLDRFKFANLDGDGRVALLQPFDILYAAVAAVIQTFDNRIGMADKPPRKLEGPMTSEVT